MKTRFGVVRTMRNVGAHALTTVGQLVLNRIPEVDSKPADPPTLT